VHKNVGAVRGRRSAASLPKQIRSGVPPVAVRHGRLPHFNRANRENSRGRLTKVVAITSESDNACAIGSETRTWPVFVGLVTLLPNFFYRHDNIPIFERDVGGRGKFIGGPAGTNFLDREVNGSVTNGELEG
jgi:hypothetical protein